MARVEPVPGAAAATADLDGGRALIVADYHAGFEAGLRRERGVSIASRAERRREGVLSLVADVSPDRVVFLGDLMHSIGGPGGAERGEIEVLLEELAGALPAGEDPAVTLVKGNHDGDVESWVEGVEVTPGTGARIGDVGLAHGHTWPAADVLGASVVCVGHEHPRVRLEDEVGGSRVRRVWLRGPLRHEPFARRYDDVDWGDPELVVFPAYNELAGGTWVNVEGQSFLCPFLPDALDGAEAFLLDGTRLGDYRSV